MNIKHILIVALFTFSTQFFAQTNFETHLQKGIKYHDAGNYDQAIESYNKALELQPNSALIFYEISLSYMSKGDYENTIKYADKVLKQNSKYMVQAYINKGSALDLLGKTKASIKLFNKAIKRTEGHYLLYYNLALNHYKINELDQAEENAINAIKSNSNHASSHLMLALINNQKGNTVQSLLAAHYFLFLEPDSKRSAQAYQVIENNFGGNVSKDKNKPNNINMTLSFDDDEFSAVALMISMLSASNLLEENEGKTEDELFVSNTESFFKVLGELKKDSYKSIWWTFYANFFYNVAKSGHIETYCKYITQGVNENSNKWLIVNEIKLNNFANWVQKN